MSCSVSKNCHQISRKLTKITNDLNNLLCDICPNENRLKSYPKRPSKLYLEQNGGALSDWYLRPLHLSSTVPLNSQEIPDPKPPSAEIVPSTTTTTAAAAAATTTTTKDAYLPGTVGTIIADIKQDIEKEKNNCCRCLTKEPAEKRRVDRTADYKPNKVFTAQGKDQDVHLDDYIDETDMENLNVDTAKTTSLVETNDQAVTPFYVKLAQLRMEELLLEEERLLEMKRIQELIRTRRPRKYWYMLRSREFTEELMRNTDMLRNEQHQEEIDKYRAELIKGSLKTGKIFWKPLIQ